MPEENTANEGAEKQPSGENNSESGADKTTDTNVEGGDTGNKGADEGKGDNKPKDGEKAPNPKDKTQLGENEDDNEEPPTRKVMTPKDWIIKRKDEKIQKLQEDSGKPDENEEEGEDEEINPADRKMVARIVEPMLNPILEKTLAAEDDKEINQFLKENPEFLPFEKKARRFIAHPSRRHLPVAAVFYEVAGRNLIKIGAERQKVADEKAKQTQTGGGSARGGNADKGIWDMSEDEFRRKQDEVRRKGQF